MSTEREGTSRVVHLPDERVVTADMPTDQALAVEDILNEAMDESAGHPDGGYFAVPTPEHRDADGNLK